MRAKQDIVLAGCGGSQLAQQVKVGKRHKDIDIPSQASIKKSKHGDRLSYAGEREAVGSVTRDRALQMAMTLEFISPLSTAWFC